MEENKPVIVGGISAATLITLLQSIITLGRVFGWWSWTDEEEKAVLAVIQISIPILVIGITTWWTAKRTTSLAKPTDEDGVRLVREPDKSLAKQEVRSIEKKFESEFYKMRRGL